MQQNLYQPLIFERSFMGKNSGSKIFWIFGNSGSGKTTLAKQMQSNFNAVILDGDDLRTVWKLGLEKADREEQNFRAARMAMILKKQGFNVIVSTICPYNDLRQRISEMCNPEWIYLPGGHESTREYPFEKPQHDALTLDPIPNQTNIQKVLTLMDGDFA